MGPALTRVPFSERLRLSPAVQAFNCGSASYEQEIAEWLRSSDGAVLAMASTNRREHADVWLYLTPRGELVGYSSLGRTRWPFEEPYNRPIDVAVIPYVGLAVDFQREPKSAPAGEHYSDSVMDDLIAEAEQLVIRLGLEPFLVLYVHPLNVHAKSFYRRKGFTDYTRTHDGNDSMVRRLAVTHTSAPSSGT